MKLQILKYIEKAYDSIYDLNSNSNYKYDKVLDDIEAQANEYGYKFKLNARDVWKLYKMTSQEWETFREVEE